MITKNLEPSVHAVYLIVVFSLSPAFVDVTLGPFSVTGGDLFDTDKWLVFVVSQEFTKFVGKTIGLIVGSSFTVGWSTWSTRFPEFGVCIGTTIWE